MGKKCIAPTVWLNILISVLGERHFAPTIGLNILISVLGEKCFTPTVWLNILISVLGEKCFAPTFFQFRLFMVVFNEFFYLGNAALVNEVAVVGFAEGYFVVYGG